MKNELTNTAMVVTDSAKGAHIGLLVELGRALPKSKGMLRRWNHLDVLGAPDVAYIKSVFPDAKFKRTKSGTFMRLINFEAFKAEYAKTV